MENMPIQWNRGEHGCPDVAWDLIESLPVNSEISAHSRITNEIGGVTWVAYVISSKPPSTIKP